ncbi:hypothetical protein CRUP_012783 [Coryphaenoides rupestris]|nr:hypothetical protein CRUP_012783 [Coryphaenoides rupestris]
MWAVSPHSASISLCQRPWGSWPKPAGHWGLAAHLKEPSVFTQSKPWPQVWLLAEHSLMSAESDEEQGNIYIMYTDVNECAALSQPCSPGFACLNTAGSYTCQRKMLICSRGYHASADGVRCLCHNLQGSYSCDCQPGYQYDSFRRTCVGTSGTGGTGDRGTGDGGPQTAAPRIRGRSF